MPNLPNSLTSASSNNVKVAVRLRPLNAREQLAGSTEAIAFSPHSSQIHAGPEHCFTFDSVFGPDSGQKEVFETLVHPLLESFINGYNCTILAYGQVKGRSWGGNTFFTLL